MYKYVEALTLERSANAQWKIVDLESTPVKQIFSVYVKVYLTLTTIYLDEPVFVDMDTLRGEFSNFSGTLEDLFTVLGTRALLTVPALPNTDIKYVKYCDAIRAEYKVQITKVGVANTLGLPRSDLVDLKLTRPNFETDMALLHTHCLVSVNGYIHRTDSDGQNAFVYEGAKSLGRSNHSHIGIHSFLDIGAIKKVPIDPANIYGQTVGDPSLKTRAYLQLNEDLTGKSVFLVLGGYMIFPQDNVFWQSGDNIFALNVGMLPLLERYYESSMYLDLSALQLSEHSENPDIVNVEEFFSDDVLKRYMTLSQSFFVIVDTPHLFVGKLALRDCNLPGMFTAYHDPEYPMIVNYGKLAEYWKVKEDGQWSVSVQDSFMRNFVFTTRPIAELNNVTSNGIPNQTFKNSQGHLLQIGAY